jgi:hypothetical protein
MSIYQQDDIFSIRDILDSQLESQDEIALGRVADIAIKWQEDGSLVLTSVQLGPQALAGRIGLKRLAKKIFRDRFEHEIAISEIENFGPTLKLRGKAEDYNLARAEHWIAKYVLRWIPGSGYAKETE